MFVAVWLLCSGKRNWFSYGLDQFWGDFEKKETKKDGDFGNVEREKCKEAEQCKN